MRILLFLLLLAFLFSCGQPEDFWQDVDEAYKKDDLKKVERRILNRLKNEGADDTETTLAYGYLGLIMLKDNNVSYAAESFKRFRSLRIKKNQEAYNKLKERIDEAVRTHDNDLLVRIKQEVGKKNYIQAIMLYEEIILLEPESDTMRKSYIQFLTDLGLHEKALSIARESPNTDKKSLIDQIVKDQQTKEKQLSQNSVRFARGFWMMQKVENKDIITKTNMILEASKSTGLGPRQLSEKWSDVIRSPKIILQLWNQAP